MKLKILLILILFFTLNVLLNAKNTIKNIEYLKGDDFVQLYFKINGIIPIPDLFYPDENNSRFIVMRINDINLEKRTVYVRHNPVNNHTTKNKKSRISFFNQDAKIALFQYIKEYINNDIKPG